MTDDSSQPPHRPGGEPTLVAAIERLERSDFREIQRLGFHFQRNDFYSPLADCAFLEENPDLWWQRPAPVAIEWRDEAQLELISALSPFLAELHDVPVEAPRTGAPCYAWDNLFWNSADALVQYGLYRLLRPRRIVEIGCGWSTLLMRRAIEANGESCRVDLVEPHPDLRLLADLPEGWRLHQTMLQRAPLELFTELGAGDVCFYDGSHCAKIASDVNWFFFEVLPRLAPGVLVHVHDIFLPDDYPQPWLFEQGRSWNEQYLLQAFLMYNRAFEVLAACSYLFRYHQEFLEARFQGLQPAYGCSFWMRRCPADK